MSSIILICDNIPTTHERLVELMKSLGPETRMLVFDDTDKMSFAGPCEGSGDEGLKYAISELLGHEMRCVVIDAAEPSFEAGKSAPERHRPVNMGAIGRRHGLTSIALSIRALAPRPTMEAPPPSSLEKAFGMMEAFDEEFFFEKPKPDWPKPDHIRPTAQWKHRHSASHPARSRDKRFMR